MIQGGDVRTGVVFIIQGGFLLGGSGASGDRVTWSGIIFFLLVTGSRHMARFATKAEFILETAVFFFHRKFTERLRTLRNRGIDLSFVCDKVAVSGRRRRAWSSRVLTLVDFIGTIKFAGLGYKVG